MPFFNFAEKTTYQWDCLIAAILLIEIVVGVVVLLFV